MVVNWAFLGGMRLVNIRSGIRLRSRGSGHQKPCHAWGTELRNAGGFGPQPHGAQDAGCKKPMEPVISSCVVDGGDVGLHPSVTTSHNRSHLVVHWGQTRKGARKVFPGKPNPKVNRRVFQQGIGVHLQIRFTGK